jgi:Lrp/AsnC family transcriptional regulator of ectoine degradation
MSAVLKSLHRETAPPRRLDARDLKILEIIQCRGRISTKALAHAIGLSLTPCFERLRRLESEGFISGYRGVVDARRVGPCLWVYANVTLSRHHPQDFASFEAAVQDIPEIIACDALGGGVDYVLTFVARDIAHYQELADDLLARDIGIETYRTYVVTRRVKDTSPIPVTTLLAPTDAESPGAAKEVS